MNYVKLVLTLAVAWAVSGCSTPPKFPICTVINSKVANCRPSQPGDEPYDKAIKRMRGYQCIHWKDVGKIKNYIHEITDKAFNGSY